VSDIADLGRAASELFDAIADGDGNAAGSGDLVMKNFDSTVSTDRPATIAIPRMTIDVLIRR
jgi:hypothetical protein